MIRRIYSVFDKVAQEFGPLQVMKNDGTAWRWFNHVKEQEGVGNHDDFALFYLGEYESEVDYLADEYAIDPCVPQEVVANVNMEIEDE